MKNWLRIFILITCLVGLTPLLRIQAQKRATIIQTAALHDQTGRVVDTVTSHQPQNLWLALTVNLPAGTTEIAVADPDVVVVDQAKLQDGHLQDGVTAKVNRQQHLVLENTAEKSQKLDLVVPLKVADPLLASKLQLDLEVVDTPEKFTLPAVGITAEATDKEAVDPATSSSSSQASSQESVASQTTASQRSQTTKQRTRAASSQSKSSSTSKQSAESADDDADADPATKVSRAAVTDPRKNLTGETIPTYRGQILMDSWSEELVIGGSLLDSNGSNLTGPKEAIAGSRDTYWNDTYNHKDQYYYSYQKLEKEKEDGDEDGDGDGLKARAYAVTLGATQPKKEDTIVVYYQNVGAYTDEPTEGELNKDMGVIITISNIIYNDKTPSATNRYIDFSNNFYSGMVYNGLLSFDLDVTFTNDDGTKALDFLAPEGDDKHRSYVTFGSLNGNNEGEHEWAGTRKKGLEGEVSADTLVKKHDDGWYEGIGEGVWDLDKTYTGENQWGDFQGSTNYERGAVSFPISGTTHEFKLKGESGFTWQSLSSGYVVPLQPPKPKKTVHSVDKVDVEFNDLDKVTIDRDSDDMSSFYYTIYQPTYSIPNQSIAKPNNITFTDTLPEGMTVTTENIRLFNTDGKEIKVTPKGTVTVGTNGRDVMYDLSDKEIETLKFNGGSFAIQLKVNFKADFEGTFKNKATVKFDSGGQFVWTDTTNEVETHFKKSPLTITLKKVGDLPWEPKTNTILPGVTFDLQDTEGGEKRTVVTEKDGTVQLDRLDREKTYTLTERQLDGYTTAEAFQLKYNKSKKQWELVEQSAQVKIDDAVDQKQEVTVQNRVLRGQYQFQKVDGSTKKPLTGAEFIVQNADKKYLTFDEDGKMKGVVDGRDAATELTGDQQGLFKIHGLPHGDYLLIETKAPSGYAIGEAREFSVSDKTSEPEKVENDPYVLPVTGGHGIYGFIVLGLILTLSSLAIWRTHPRGGKPQ